VNRRKLRGALPRVTAAIELTQLATITVARADSRAARPASPHGFGPALLEPLGLGDLTGFRHRGRPRLIEQVLADQDADQLPDVPLLGVCPVAEQVECPAAEIGPLACLLGGMPELEVVLLNGRSARRPAARELAPRLGSAGGVLPQLRVPGRGQALMAVTPGRSPKRAFASRLTMIRPVSAACAAMIRSCAPRGVPVRRMCASRRACLAAVTCV
jgi:hypothetical protein